MKTKRSKLIEQDLTIVEFIRHPELLNDQTNSPAQDAFLKSLYGLPLDEAEKEIYFRGTGREVYLAREQQEVTLIGGRRGGKTRMGARIALYESCRDHQIPPGERAFVYFVAPTVAQAKIAYDYLKKDILSSSVLRKKVAKFHRNEIELTNGVTLGCYPCSLVAVRGKAVLVAVGDELGFWRNEVTSVHCDSEVLAAIRPAMVSFPTSKLVKLTTPHAKRGIAWEEYQQRGEIAHCVWQLSTQELNPSIPIGTLEIERERDSEQFKREYLAQFTESVVSWIEPEHIDACIVRGRRELPRVNNVTYAAAVDPAFKRSDFGLAIAHRTREGLIVFDLVRGWTGSRSAPLGFERVCREIADHVRFYGIYTLHGDQFAAVAIQQEFQKLGFFYKEETFNRYTRARLFNNLKHLLQQRKIELLDQPDVLKQLRALEEFRTSDGDTDVRPATGKDDLAIVVAMCALKLSQSGEPLLCPIIMGHFPQPWDGMLPIRHRNLDAYGGIPVGPDLCSKFPKCWAEGFCECYGC